MTVETRPAPDQGRGRLILIALFAIAGIPALAAAWMVFSGVGIPEGRSNHGDLVWPVVEAADFSLAPETLASRDLLQEDGRPRWLLLRLNTLPDAACDARCEESAWLAGQVNIALGKYAARVGRLDLTAQQSDRIQALLAERGVAAEPWDLLVMDPNGNVMLRYGAEHEGRDMLDDLKKLLKISKIG